MKSSNWVLYRSAGYLTGKGITFGQSVVPSAARQLGKFSVEVDCVAGGGAQVIGEDLGQFADGSMDHVFVGKRLESLYDPSALMREAQGKLKVGGHLVVNTLIGHSQPGVREFYPSTITEMVGDVGKWRLKAAYEQDGQLLQIYKKLPGKRGVEDGTKRTSSKPRACVVRYGAIGDAIILSPLLRKFDEDGYEVTLNVTPYCLAPLEHNPHVSNVIIQEKDIIPNPELGEYWNTWKSEYDKYINLSESLEGGLLKVEGRMDFFTTQAWRHKTCNVNYYDRTMKLGGYDVVGQRGEMFFTPSEERQVRKVFDPLAGKFVVLWALNGSSHHKIYPLMEAVLEEWLPSYPNACVITVGDEMARLMEFDHPQVIQMAAKWPIRQALLATKYASCVVGPETAITNAAGCYPTPKITLLSHSTHENLCKHWENDYCLAPNTSISPCYPCHQLHYSKESCPTGIIINEISKTPIAEGPLCAMGAIEGERVMQRLTEVYNNHGPK